MSLHFQAATLVGSPSYPNAVTWSEENLLAVASAHIVTILNPTMPCGPRGVINIPASKPFPIGVIERKDLFACCLLPSTLSRDTSPCVRSISWSPIGIAPNSGCLLAVCTAHGEVKLYRMPFREFSAEWVEVLDITDKLHSYLSSVGFEDKAIVPVEVSDEQESATFNVQSCTDNMLVPFLTKCKRRRDNASSLVEIEHDNQKNNTSTTRSKARKTSPGSDLPVISAEQYASRYAMLSSLVVSWSPILYVPREIGKGSTDKSSIDCSILAIGAKSGKIAFWRIHGPDRYSIENNNESISASLIGLLEAHRYWITAVSWSFNVSSSSGPQLLLATGSSNGSAKVWQMCSAELLKSSGVSEAPFSLMKEIMADDSDPVSTIALLTPLEAPDKLLLAVGKGSGSVEVWSCDVPTSKFEKAGTYDAHDHIVTGLAWAYDGKCLYSCSQDNSFRSWILNGNILQEASIPSNTPGVKSSSDVPHAFDSCYGVAFSPGNLVIALVHSFDTDVLNPMYEKRALKGAVEFLWAGGQQVDNPSEACLDFDVESLPNFIAKELVCWESNTLWSLHRLECLDKPLVTWDVIAALSAFKQSIPKYMDHLLLQWLGSYVGESFGSCVTILSEVSRSLSKMTTRQLNLINVITRHLVLKEPKVDKFNVQLTDVEEVSDAEECYLWMELFKKSEMELRIRLVGFSFSAVRSLLSSDLHMTEYWKPVGIAQMAQWVALNKNRTDSVKLLAEDIGMVEKSRLQSLPEYVTEERCSFCSASVPFENAEEAFCQGAEHGEEVGPRHKLARCAVSMRVCPASPTWYCASCYRRSTELISTSFFSIHGYRPSYSVAKMESLKPICPFCGVLLQKLQPPFLLSPSPV